MTASSEYVLKTLENDFAFYRSSFHTGLPFLGAYSAMLAVISAFTVSIILPHSFETGTTNIAGFWLSSYWITLVLVWLLMLVSGFYGMKEKRSYSFDLGSFVRSVEHDERHRLSSTVHLADCSTEVQNLVMEIVRIEVTKRLAEENLNYRETLRGRIKILVFIVTCLILNLFSFFSLLEKHHLWFSPPLSGL